MSQLTERDVKMIQEVAKAASEQTAERVKAQLSTEMELQMLRLEKRLSEELGSKIESKMNAAMGMDPASHAAEHVRFGQMLKSWDDFASTWRKRIATVAIGAIFVIAAGGLAFTSEKAAGQKAITSREYESGPKAETHDEADR